jgi:threonine dehydrogenase-like Zn-dependent dehydrogenase
MKAIGIIPGQKAVQLVERDEPIISADDEIKVKILRVGICGTDREEANGGRALLPQDHQDLVIGHEMLGQVVEVGKSVERVAVGDHAVFTVRRGCGECLPCVMNRSDMCRTGKYLERGIWGLDGYQAEYVVDKEQYVVKISPQLSNLGVLVEPLSVAEKAIDEVIRIQNARLPDALSNPDWLYDRRCLVAGLGPIGLLAAMVLRMHHAQVYGLDVVEADSARPTWLAGIGGKYVDGREISADRLDDKLGEMDLIFEATGVAALEFNLLDALAPDGVYVLTGIPGGERPLEVPAAELIRQLVLDNQVMVGSVNASRDHFQMAVDDLSHAHLLWGDMINRLITHRYSLANFHDGLMHHPSDEIKAVVEWVSR